MYSPKYVLIYSPISSLIIFILSKLPKGIRGGFPLVHLGLLTIELFFPRELISGHYLVAGASSVNHCQLIDEDDESPIIRGFSDDEPLVMTGEQNIHIKKRF